MCLDPVKLESQQLSPFSFFYSKDGDVEVLGLGGTEIVFLGAAPAKPPYLKAF